MSSHLFEIDCQDILESLQQEMTPQLEARKLKGTGVQVRYWTGMKSKTVLKTKGDTMFLRHIFMFNLNPKP